MRQPMIVILMGSRADESHCQKIAETADLLGIYVEIHVGSAHKTPQHVLDMLQKYESDSRPKVYITVAGRSNALSGFVDGAVKSPVIACPPPSDAFGGADIFSSLRMPSGIAPAVVLEPANAALLAAKMLGLTSENVRNAIANYQRTQVEKILLDNSAIQS